MTKPTKFTPKNEGFNKSSKILEKILADKTKFPSVSEKYIVLTGIKTGIGEALAYALAKNNARLILIDSNVLALQKVSDNIEKLIESEAICLPIDLAGATYDDYNTVADKVSEVCPHINGIIHNAARFDGLYSIHQTPPDKWLLQLQVNLTAPLWITQAFWPLLKKADNKTILFPDHKEISKKAYWGTYSIGKSALNDMMNLFATENDCDASFYFYGYNTGNIDTPLMRDAFPDGKSDWIKNCDLSYIHFILSLFDNKYKTGSVIDMKKK